MSVALYIPDATVLGAAATICGAAVPANTKRLIKSAVICNPTVTPILVTVYMVPAGAAPGPGNMVISARPIAGNDSYVCHEAITQGLAAGGTLQGLGAGLSLKHTATDIV